MILETFSVRELVEDVDGAKKAALAGPVFITDGGRPSHVLLSIEEYERLTGREPSLLDLLAAPGTEDIDFEPPRVRSFPREVELD